MKLLALFVIGLLLLFLASSHRLQAVADLERPLELKLHRFLSQKPWIDGVRIIWLLGRAETLMILVIALVFINPAWGISAGIAYLVWSAIDRGLKVLFKRQRPYEKVEGVTMLQPHRPHDPSFPSGDAFHIWFLVTIAILAFHLGWLPAALLIVLALLVCMGRIAMGVHFPTDILAGTGLGLASAAFTAWLANLLLTLIFLK